MQSQLDRARARVQALRRSGRAMFVVTQGHLSHSFPLIAPSWPTVVVSDLAAATNRRAAVDRALARIRATGRELGNALPITVVLDSAESWFPTSVCFRLRRAEPTWGLVGLQHGVMEITGPESILNVRRIRKRMCAIEERILGHTTVGVGFANAPLDMLVCYGPVYGAYARDLNPRIETIESHALLCDLPAKARVPTCEGLRRVLFLSQDVQVFGARSPEKLFRRLSKKLRQLEAVAGAQVIIKEHPKWRMPGQWMPDFPRVDGTLREVLERCEIDIVISFNSTGLYDAARSGHRVVALRIPEAHSKWYEMFANAIPIDSFLSSWSFDDFSEVADGFAA